MPYAVVEDFRSGVDRRRARESGVPGTLWVGSNCHITKGGEIEKRKRFTNTFALYQGHTFGFKGVGGVPFVFGWEDPATFPTGAIPAGVTYQRCAHTTPTTPMVAVLDAIAFLGGVYVIAKYQDGAIFHFWNGARVTNWDGGAGNPTAVGTFGCAVGTKIYIAAGSIVFFCDINNPALWTIGAGTSGAGFFNVVSSGKGSENLVAMAPYQSGMAFYASSYVQTWSLQADQTKNAFQSTVDNTGAISPHGLLNFGNVDQYYLGPSGIRSLRQQYITGQPYAADVGDNIETLVQADLAALSTATLQATAASVNPFDGRIWFWIGTKIYVLSAYSSSKVEAWTWYDMGSLTPGNLDIVGRRMFIRAGDTLYVYGGTSGTDYDTGPSDAYNVDVELPYMHAGRIADRKTATSYNVGGEGEWQVFMKSDPTNFTVEDALGTVDYYTYDDPKYGMAIESTHFGPRFHSTLPGPAKICNFDFAYDKD